MVGDKPLKEISCANMWAVQKRIEARGTLAVAKKVRTWLYEVFGYAVALGKLELNPTRYLDELALPDRAKRTVNHFLSIAEIPELFVCLGRYRGNLATQLLLLMGVRLADLRFAQVQHFDFKQSLWQADVFRGCKVLENPDRHRLIQPAYI